MGWFDFLKPKITSPVMRYSLPSEDEEKVREGWRRIEELIGLAKPSQMKQAVIEADKLLDFILKRLVAGETMGERLKAARGLLDPEAYDGLWQAHKVRNSLVHEDDYDPPSFVCRETVVKFKEAILSLKIRLNGSKSSRFN